jgi:hypothetical protein
VLRFLVIESAYRSLIIIFFLKAYLDLFLGGLLNSENDYLMDDPDNWGRRGTLSISDQFGIIIGNIIYVSCVVFPFIVFSLVFPTALFIPGLILLILNS